MAQIITSRPDPQPDHGSPYYPGAEAWYFRQAREILDDSGFLDLGILPDPADIPEDGFGVRLWHAVHLGLVTVQVFTATPAQGRRKARLHDERHRRNPAAEQHWTAARQMVYRALEAAGLEELTYMRCGVRARVPAPESMPEVQLTHHNVFEEGLDALGRHTVTVSGHPHLRGRLETAYGTATERAFTYVYPSWEDTDPLSGHGFKSLADAAEMWALHCGLPPVTVTQS